MHNSPIKQGWFTITAIYVRARVNKTNRKLNYKKSDFVQLDIGMQFSGNIPDVRVEQLLTFLCPQCDQNRVRSRFSMNRNSKT